MLITVYIIPGGNKVDKSNFLKAADGWGNEKDVDVRVLSVGEFDKLFPDSKWKAFIYSNEELGDSLKEVLPDYLSTNIFDFLSLYRKGNEGTYWLAPRIFKSRVQLLKEAPYMKDEKGDLYRGETILDGWIVEQ